MFTVWTQDQWIAFLAITTAGLSALGLAVLAARAVRSWAPTTVDLRRIAPRGYAVRPTVALAARRVPLPAWAFEPTVLEHVAPGPGSLASLREVGPGTLVAGDPPVAPDVAAWFVEAFDRPAHVPTPTEAGTLDEGGVLTRFHAAMDAPMRTARLWLIRAEGLNGHTSARQQLNEWRVNTPTGEYAMIAPAT